MRHCIHARPVNGFCGFHSHVLSQKPSPPLEGKAMSPAVMCSFGGACTRSACTPILLPMPPALPTPHQNHCITERRKHLRLQRDLRLGPGRGQETEEPECHPQNGPGPHPPCANHQQEDQTAGCGGSLSFLLPRGGSHAAPAMLPHWVSSHCGAKPRGDPGCLRPGNATPATGCCHGVSDAGQAAINLQGPSLVGTRGCSASLHPEEQPCWEGDPRCELR